MRKLIKVTKEDIKKGLRDDSESCPVALACKRSLKIEPDEYISVDTSGISTLDGDFNTPNSVIKFIEAFDSGRSVKPFNFWLKD